LSILKNMIEISVRSITPIANISKLIEDSVRLNLIDIEVGIDNIANATLDYMRQFITSSLKRGGSAGNLVQQIGLEEVHMPGTGDAWFGIGDIAQLDKAAPYWHLINYGGHTVASQTGMGIPGSFGGNPPDPSKAGGGSMGAERWGSGNFMMFPKFPIEPMNYIENAEAFLHQQLNILIST